ncbi:MAG: DUF6122 family protein [Gammaproteobacteria bacterium]|nr:DUF6122 family protein [Gammaproteobacteria bacterium]
MIHIALHFLTPGLIAGIFYSKKWLKSFGLLLCGLIIDVDHLLAAPLYDPNRCSIGFHPLHTWFVMPLYVALLFHPKTRLVGLGLCIHILLDIGDCLVMGNF